MTQRQYRLLITTANAVAANAMLADVRAGLPWQRDDLEFLKKILGVSGDGLVSIEMMKRIRECLEERPL